MPSLLPCQRISPSFDFPFPVSPMHLFSFSLYRCSLKRRRRSKKYKKWCPWGLSVMLWPIATFLMHLFEVRTNVCVCSICKQNNRRYCDGEFLVDLRRVFVCKRWLVRHYSHHLKWHIIQYFVFLLNAKSIWVIAKNYMSYTLYN